ncbi:hypothetical protein TNCV_1172241 [Trichonephila clavipes]|uniref:Uncharacterized protein n=1 Tax=Trichonephila clavipes TaxID=2585209 RepID=A0A8X6VDB4_TRICX|nr:hypothetical protein TNCV_1172241 [Trichonephila clavipes]
MGHSPAGNPLSSWEYRCHTRVQLIHNYAQIVYNFHSPLASRNLERGVFANNFHVASKCYIEVAEVKLSRYRIVAGLVTSSNPVPLKTRRVGQRCTLNLSKAQTSSRGVVW